MCIQEILSYIMITWKKWDNSQSLLLWMFFFSPSVSFYQLIHKWIIFLTHWIAFLCFSNIPASPTSQMTYKWNALQSDSEFYSIAVQPLANFCFLLHILVTFLFLTLLIKIFLLDKFMQNIHIITLPFICHWKDRRKEEQKVRWKEEDIDKKVVNFLISPIYQSHVSETQHLMQLLSLVEVVLT